MKIKTQGQEKEFFLTLGFFKELKKRGGFDFLNLLWNRKISEAIGELANTERIEAFVRTALQLQDGQPLEMSWDQMIDVLHGVDVEIRSFFRRPESGDEPGKQPQSQGNPTSGG